MEAAVRALLQGHEHADALCALWALEASRGQQALASAARELANAKEFAARELESAVRELAHANASAARELESAARELAHAKESAAREREVLVQARDIAVGALRSARESNERALESMRAERAARGAGDIAEDAQRSASESYARALESMRAARAVRGAGEGRGPTGRVRHWGIAERIARMMDELPEPKGDAPVPRA